MIQYTTEGRNAAITIESLDYDKFIDELEKTASRSQII